MRFGLLGPVEFRPDGKPVSAGGLKQRSLLAVLLLQANKPVSRDRLISAVWAGSPPPSANAALDAYLYRLRRLVGSDRLERRAAGYVLRVEPDELDAEVFDRLVATGRAAMAAGDYQAAARQLSEALAQWRGPALADLADQPFAGGEIVRLEEARLGALEDCLDAELAAGRAAELVSPLERSVAEHPLRERLAAAHMLALYRSGRQSDALAAYRGARRRLIDELGLEPGPALRELEQRILRHDPALGAPPMVVAGVGGEAPRDMRPTVSGGGVVGRDRELATMAAFLDVLPSGASGFLLEGAAGTGKTTVWGAGIAAAAARGYAILAARPNESEATLSFAALGDLLHDEIRGEVLPGLPPPQRRALEVALLIADPAGNPPEQRAVCLGFLGVLRHLAATRPVVMAIDDMQWLDRPSAAALEFALRRLGSEPAGLLASVRTPVGLQAVRSAVAALPAERMTRLEVGPLSATAFEAVLRAGTGAGLSRLTIGRLFDATDGNPFYGLELARALSRVGKEPLPGEPLPVPADLRGVVRARLAAFPDEVQGVLLAAACLRSPTTDMLQRAADGPLVSAALHAAAREGVIEFEDARVRFTHPLLASAIYSAVPQDRRRATHRRLSTIVPSAEERARHLALSVPGPDEGVAAALSEAAATVAARGATAAAADLARLGTALTPPDRAAARWRRRLAAGAYLFRAGDTARARSDLEALVAEMPAGPDRAEARLLLAKILLHDAGDPAAVPVLEQALGEAGTDPGLRARVHVSLARTCGDDLRYCARHAAAGLALARQTTDRGLIGEALLQKVYADHMTGKGLDLESGTEAMELEREAGSQQVEERAALMIGVCLVRADRFDEARPFLDQTVRAARDEGDDSSLPVALAYLADLECWAGNWQRAERHAADSWLACEQVGHRAWRTVAWYARALVDAHLGRVNAARTEAGDGLSVASAARDAWAIMMLDGVLGFTELSAGNLAAAEASLSHAAALAERIGLAEPAAWRFHANHAEAVIGLGDLDQAEGLVKRLEAWGSATGRAWTLATAARCRGLLLAARGDTPAAIGVLAEALGHHERLPMPFELGRTLLVTGQAQRRAKRKLAARQCLAQALEIFESLPAPLWAQRARSELSRIGLPPPAPLALTATEQRVADLVAAGQTNRQVAHALLLSSRTVEANLARVYRKLGVSSRAELGAAMARLHVETPDSS